MGIVLQDPYLFTGTIASNVAMSQDHIDRDAVRVPWKKSELDATGRAPWKGIDQSVVKKDPPFQVASRQWNFLCADALYESANSDLDEATSHIDHGNRRNHPEGYGSPARAGPPLSLPILVHYQDADQILVLSEGRSVEYVIGHENGTQGGIYAQIVRPANSCVNCPAEKKIERHSSLYLVYRLNCDIIKWWSRCILKW